MTTRSAVVAAAVLVLFLVTGCHTTKNPAVKEVAGEATASVQIRGNTPGQISQAATKLFQENGYIKASGRAGELVFEKPAGKFSNFAYGSWISDTPVWLRVKLFIIPTGDQEYTLAARAYHVRDRGSSMEEEVRIHGMGSGPFQKLLDEVAAQFHKTSP